MEEYKLFYEKKSIYHKEREWRDCSIQASSDDEARKLSIEKIITIEFRSGASTLIPKAYLITPSGKEIKLHDSTDEG